MLLPQPALGRVKPAFGQQPGRHQFLCLTDLRWFFGTVKQKPQLTPKPCFLLATRKFSGQPQLCGQSLATLLQFCGPGGGPLRHKPGVAAHAQGLRLPTRVIQHIGVIHKPQKIVGMRPRHGLHGRQGKLRLAQQLPCSGEHFAVGGVAPFTASQPGDFRAQRRLGLLVDQ